MPGVTASVICFYSVCSICCFWNVYLPLETSVMRTFLRTPFKKKTHQFFRHHHLLTCSQDIIHNETSVPWPSVHIQQAKLVCSVAFSCSLYYLKMSQIEDSIFLIFTGVTWSNTHCVRCFSVFTHQKGPRCPVLSSSSVGLTLSWLLYLYHCSLLLLISLSATCQDR